MIYTWFTLSGKTVKRQLGPPNVARSLPSCSLGAWRWMRRSENIISYGSGPHNFIRSHINIYIYTLYVYEYTYICVWYHVDIHPYVLCQIPLKAHFWRAWMFCKQLHVLWLWEIHSCKLYSLGRHTPLQRGWIKKMQKTCCRSLQYTRVWTICNPSKMQRFVGTFLNSAFLGQSSGCEDRSISLTQVCCSL